jgi:hypothetical protein
MLLVWDFARMVRETVIFKEDELEENQWDVVSQIECLILEVATKYGIPRGQLLTEKVEKWSVKIDRIEAWTDLGEMPEDVFEHSRLMAAMNVIMTEGARSEVSLR